MQKAAVPLTGLRLELRVYLWGSAVEEQTFSIVPSHIGYSSALIIVAVINGNRILGIHSAAVIMVTYARVTLRLEPNFIRNTCAKTNSLRLYLYLDIFAIILHNYLT